MTKNGPPREALPLTAEQLRSVDEHAAARRFDRQRPAGGRVRALHRLHEMLVNDAQLYQGSLQAQRDAVVHSIQSVMEYLAEQGFAGPTLEPLNRVALSLVERESNRSDPLFERARSGAPKRSLASQHRAGAVAALSDEWLKMHAESDEKHEAKLRALVHKLSGQFFGKITYSKVKSAREVASQEGKDHPVVSWRNFYREQLTKASKMFGAVNAFRIVLHNLNRTAGPLERQDWRT